MCIECVAIIIYLIYPPPSQGKLMYIGGSSVGGGAVGSGEGVIDMMK